LIHEIVKDLSKEEFPGVHSINAVDAAGVHPLLLAVGSERYMPFREERPEEILTIANHLLGKGQTSLAKFLWIANHYDDPDLHAGDEANFFRHMLERVDWRRDLHFQTQTTVDTLDYSGHGWNAGSKVVIAAASKEPKRNLETELPVNLNLPSIWKDVQVVLPGILGISGQAFNQYSNAEKEIPKLAEYLKHQDLKGFPLLVICDDASFTAESLNNFLWTTFTRTDPARDIYGIDSFVRQKHWGCEGALIIDARIKPHHAPVLETAPRVSEKVDKYFRKGGPLYGI
jgi:4-hydroxy-3-polyprenylbenzoate decarboxylase